MNAYHNAKSIQNEIPWINLQENERNKNRRFNGLNNNDTQGINKGNQANVTAKNVFDLLFTKFLPRMLSNQDDTMNKNLIVDANFYFFLCYVMYSFWLITLKIIFNHGLSRIRI